MEGTRPLRLDVGYSYLVGKARSYGLEETRETYSLLAADYHPPSPGGGAVLPVARGLYERRESSDRNSQTDINQGPDWRRPPTRWWRVEEHGGRADCRRR